MTRKAIPKKVKDAVLKEFDHRCAICACDRPQIHHIDENHTNNDINNLLPLCPNCHLSDQHNPTRKISILRLKLFRDYKDPFILKSQFEPIFSRSEFLDLIQENNISANECAEKSKELIEFIKFFEMGGFYSEKLEELIKQKGYVGSWNLDGDNSERIREHDSSYLKSLKSNTEEAKKLIVELLRYQKWN